MSTNDALLIFPHQLFRSNVALARGKTAFLIEDALYFQQYAFHKQKLVLHRATMRMHDGYLRRHRIATVYVESVDAPTMNAALSIVLKTAPATVHYIDPVDDWLERRLLRALRERGVRSIRHDTPMFLSSPRFIAAQFLGKRRHFMASFYADQRKELDILVRGGKPVGGRWSFDTENRKRLPKSVDPPEPAQPLSSSHVGEARHYVERHFAANPGSSAGFAYPATYEAATAWLEGFLTQRLASFGDYEDAISQKQRILFHSVLSPLLNTGLLSPREVVDAALDYARQHEVPLNSLEGFIRQIIGWREYMRGAYVYLGRRQRTTNFWRHERPLPAAFWRGDTGVGPVDGVIHNALAHGYAHHIERLMVLGNFMLLCEFRPDDVYRWFMELFIDAYDWVMVPNVYAMALYADGGTITTKPYVASSNYLMKMSDFPQGPWRGIWDGLFWRFIDEHRDFMSGNPRLRMMVAHLERMDETKRRAHRRQAETFLESLT